jgi:hypothetical protein
MDPYFILPNSKIARFSPGFPRNKLDWSNEMLIYYNNLIYKYIFPLINFLLFTAVMQRGDCVINYEVAKLRNTGGQ